MVAVGAGLCARASPVKSNASPTTSAVEQTFFFAISILLLDFTLSFAKHLSLGVAAMWLLNLRGAEVSYYYHEPPLLAVRELE
jgi:hypothetical protein